MKKLISIGSIAAVSSLALSLCSVPQAQAANLVMNGGFIPTGTNVSSVLHGPYTLDGWNFSRQSQPGSTSTNTGFNFAVPDGTAFSTNINQSGYQDDNFTLRFYAKPGQVVNSQPDASGGAASGWYLAADGYFERGAINQTLNNLIVGQQYNVSFSQASAQLDIEKGAFNESFKVGFGNSFQNSAIMSSTGAQPASDWQQQSLTFTADSPTQVLSFLAESPNNVPPFALLSGVSVEAVASGTQVPEPENYLGTLVGVGILGAAIKSRWANKKKLDL